MLTDAHCHPFDLARSFPQAEEKRRRMGVLAAASACDLEEFAFNEEAAKKAKSENAAPLLPCFAIHPQIFAAHREKGEVEPSVRNADQLALLEELAAAGRIAAVGECGFDLYGNKFRDTETQQDEVFAPHLEIAMRYDLPVALHVRRAMHKIFNAAGDLAGCKAVIFHSWPGTLEEGQSLLRRGVNAYFSFGNIVMLNHKQAIRCCSLFPAERLLTETDAPYQPPRGKDFSCWEDLPRIIETAAALRKEAGAAVNDAKELEMQIEENFKKAFCL
jgi:TatD DNase family protein